MTGTEAGELAMELEAVLELLRDGQAVFAETKVMALKEMMNATAATATKVIRANPKKPEA